MCFTHTDMSIYRLATIIAIVFVQMCLVLSFQSTSVRSEVRHTRLVYYHINKKMSREFSTFLCDDIFCCLMDLLSSRCNCRNSESSCVVKRNPSRHTSVDDVCTFTLYDKTTYCKHVQTKCQLSTS